MGATHDRALLCAGNDLRLSRRARCRLRRRGIAVVVLAVVVGLSAAATPNPRLLWNVSPSAPVGLYSVGDRSEIAAGDMVAARVPKRWRTLAGSRHYIPVNVPLVKRVAAEPGDSVCALGHEIFVNGRWVAERREADGRGRTMPWWSGCVTLRHGALFLLMESPDSFDGRYFGPTERADIIGRARLLWER